jgi:hypothetical protein
VSSPEQTVEAAELPHHSSGGVRVAANQVPMLYNFLLFTALATKKKKLFVAVTWAQSYKTFYVLNL